MLSPIVNIVKSKDDMINIKVPALFKRPVSVYPHRTPNPRPGHPSGDGSLIEFEKIGAMVQVRTFVEKWDSSDEMDYRRTAHLKIVNCSDPSFWYSRHVGRELPYVGRYSDGWKARELAGYSNIIFPEDAVLVLGRLPK